MAWVIDRSNLRAEQGFVIRGGAASDHSGHNVANAGYLNGDGIDGLVVEAH